MGVVDKLLCLCECEYWCIYSWTCTCIYMYMWVCLDVNSSGGVSFYCIYIDCSGIHNARLDFEPIQTVLFKLFMQWHSFKLHLKRGVDNLALLSEVVSFCSGVNPSLYEIIAFVGITCIGSGISF